ncbi:glycosyltransferase family 2 protein [Microbacterium esteraromaticum]|uniref:glycosyltransferase family 2 protein n=1 Tax=Microbacterium esteraromaticum TaxID=57043 RepID=UPI00309E534E
MNSASNNGRLVSVVVPVYNVETLVAACVHSLLRQTYGDIEIIIVDDGSTDNTARVCEETAAGDPRVKLLRKQNGGLSDARNFGIKNATGVFLTCVDGDDLVAADYIEQLLRPFEHPSVDLSTIGFVRVFAGYQPPRAVGSAAADYRVWSTDDALERLFLQQGITTSAWGKLYRREAFEGVMYPVGSIHEDLPVTFRLFAQARAVAVVDAVGYYYVQRAASITGHADFNRRIEAIGFAEQAVAFVATDPRLRAAAGARVLMECAYLITQVPSIKKLRSLDPMIVRTVRRYRKDAAHSAKVPTAQRITAIASYCGLQGMWILMRLRLMISVKLTRMRSEQ